jgi:Eco57I restriction-modification methylase
LGSVSFQRLSKDEAREEMGHLVEGYRRQATDLEAASSRYTETEARTDFIDRFLIILGWDVRNEAGLPQLEREVVLERTISDDVNVTGRPDYRLRVRGRDRMPVEAKKPSVRVSGNVAAAAQTRTYGWSMSLPASVLINVAETVIYDTRITYAEGDAAHVAVIPGCQFKLDEYVGRFDDLWDRLSHESAGSDRFYEIYEYSEPPRGTSPFDVTFLTEFRRWRASLAGDIAARNTLLQSAEVGRRTQRLLNALLFIRVCEDRNIGKYEDLLRSAEAMLVVEAFRRSDFLFNAGLCDVLDTTAVSPGVLAEVIAEMYWPRSKFAFGVLRPDILAALYEQYLAERVEVGLDRSVKLVAKPELTHAGGVIPTPSYIVAELLSETLSLKLEPGRVIPSDLTLLDPACGSGVFLVAALEKLITSHEQSGSQVGLAERAALAKAHLFGVDLDGEAIEVAKLSLLLTVLGDELVDVARSRHLLPDLGHNLQVGNSLVRSDFDRIVPSAAAIPERRAAVAPVDLKQLFAPVFVSGGFSVIVGNPPYIRIQTLAEFLPDQLEYFQDARSGLISAQGNSFDTYQLFVERCLDLLDRDGRLAFIIPNRFTNSIAAGHMRALVGPRLTRLVHFGEEQVFVGRSTYTALLAVGPVTTQPARFELVKDLDAWRRGQPGEIAEVNRDTLQAAPWPIASSARAAVFAKMEDAAIAHLGDADWVKIFVGVQTSADDVFFVAPEVRKSTHEFVHFTDSDGNEWDIERAILRPAIRDQKILSYDREPKPDYLAIFPYSFEEISNGRRKAKPFTKEELSSGYPAAWDYLQAQHARLEARNVTPDPGTDFWRYGRSQSLTQLDDPKLIVRVLSLMPSYAVDTKGLLAPGGGDGGPYYLLRPAEQCSYSLEVLQALVSHPAVDAFVASRGKAYRGSYVVHRKAFLCTIPIPDIDMTSQRRIVRWALGMASARERLATETDSAVRSTLVSRVASLQSSIEEAISSAYGLSAEHIATITG